MTGQTTVLQTDILYDCGKSLNPAVDLGQVIYMKRDLRKQMNLFCNVFCVFLLQIEGSFVQGLGFFMLEEYIEDPEGLLLTDSTWTYKIPTVDTIPKQFNVEILNGGCHEKRVLSSKGQSLIPTQNICNQHF